MAKCIPPVFLVFIFPYSMAAEVGNEFSKMLWSAGAEDAVAGISKTGADVGVFVETAVQVADIKLNVRVSLLQPFYPFGSSDDGHKFNVASAVLLDKIHGSYGRASSGKHGVCDYNGPQFNGGRQLAVVFVGLMGFFIPV